MEKNLVVLRVMKQFGTVTVSCTTWRKYKNSVERVVDPALRTQLRLEIKWYVFTSQRVKKICDASSSG